MFFAIILILLRANIAVIMVVLLPLTLGLSLNVLTTNMIEFPIWIFVAMLILTGLIVGKLFLEMAK